MNIAARIDDAVARLILKGWSFQRLSAAPWVADVELRIGRRLPESYRSLVVRYSFPTVELGPIELFSNQGDGSDDDITRAPFKDPILSPWLIRGGYFHFGRPMLGGYDPICLDMTQGALSKTSGQILRFEHEAILLEQSVVPRERIAESFLSLLQDYG